MRTGCAVGDQFALGEGQHATKPEGRCLFSNGEHILELTHHPMPSSAKRRRNFAAARQMRTAARSTSTAAARSMRTAARIPAKDIAETAAAETAAAAGTAAAVGIEDTAVEGTAVEDTAAVDMRQGTPAAHRAARREPSRPVVAGRPCMRWIAAGCSRTTRSRKCKWRQTVRPVCQTQ